MLKIEIDDLKMLGLKYVASAIPGKSLKRKSTVTEEELKSKPEALKKLPRNDHWKVLYKVSVFYVDRKSKMAATTGHSINTGPYGENTEIYSSLKLLH
jgi:hypothetical protein